MRRRFSIRTALPVLALSFILPAYAQDKPTDKITYQDHVRPVFENHCLNCHNPDKARGGLDLSSYGATMNGGSSGDVVAAGDPSGSRVLLTATHREEPFMPPEKPPINKNELEIISKWIESGLLDSSDSTPKKKATSSFAMSLDAAPVGKPEGPPPLPVHLRLEPYVNAARASAVADIATSPWAPLAAFAGQKQIILYNTDHRGIAGVLPHPEGFPESVAFSRNGSLLIVGGGIGGKNGKARVFDVKTGELVIELGSEFDSVLAADISPDQAHIALGGPGRNLKIYDTKSGEQIHSIKKHPDWLLHAAYSPDGKYLATGGRSGALYIWDAKKGIEFFTLKGPQEPITALSWRADSKVLATSCEDGKAYLWEMKEGKQIKAWDAHPDGALSIHFSNDGKKLVTAGRDKTVKVWDAEGKGLHTIKDFPDIVLHTAFSHDGKRILAADWTGAVTLWNTEDGAKVGALDSNPPTIAHRIDWHTKRDPELKSELAQAQKSHQAAVEKQKQHQAQIDNTKKSIAALTKQRADSEKRIAELNPAIKELTAEVNKLKGAVTNREKQVAASAGKLKQAQQKQATLKTELQKWQQRAQAAEKAKQPAAPQNKTAQLMANAVLVADNSPNPKAAPAPKGEAGKDERPARPPSAQKTTEAPKQPSPQPKPAPASPDAKKKVTELTNQLKTADKSLATVKAADTKLNEQLHSEKTNRDKKQTELQTAQKNLAETQEGLKPLPEKIKQSQEGLKKLEEQTPAVNKAVAESKSKVDSLDKQIASNDRGLKFWKAQEFHMGVLAEKERLAQLKREQPEKPTDEQKATLQYQEKKAASLHQQFLGMLPK
ncbi:MAG: c-type cytochrome domain-containing protein [Verrucomicrobiota bacterium]